jgi:S-adenosylmethionine synthetase
MSNERPKRVTMTIEVATNSNMWELAEIVEVLERTGLCTKEELCDITFTLSENQNSTGLSGIDSFGHYEVDSIHIKAGAAFPRY